MPLPLRLSAALFAASLLTGCGFHLVGADSLPDALRNVTVQPDRGLQVAEPPVAIAVRQALARRGATVESKVEKAANRLRLTGVSDYREIIALGIDGKALEYRLVQSVTYELFEGGQRLAGPDSVTVSRDYSFQIDQILAKEQEEQELREYLQQQLANLVLLRIENTLRHQTGELPAPAVQTVPPAKG